MDNHSLAPLAPGSHQIGQALKDVESAALDIQKALGEGGLVDSADRAAAAQALGQLNQAYSTLCDLHLKLLAG